MKGYFRKDDDGHNYFVPESKIKSFDKAIRDIEESNEHSEEWYENIDYFLSRFDEYRCQPPSTYLVEVDNELLK